MADSNYSFVIDSSFKPFTFQEILTPLMMYKEAYEKSEAAYEDLTNKSDKFKLLAKNLPEGSEAKAIYDSYSKELQDKAKDLATNGLSMNNRIALTNLRRRYQGEIGMLLDADAETKQKNALITQQRLKDPSMLFATPKVTIDDIVSGKTINDYAISGNELYTRGQQLGKAYSARKVSDGEGGKTLGDLYRTWISTVGYSPETLEQFRQNAATLPEVQEAIEDIMKEKRINENLSEEDAKAAAQGILNGFLDGAIYSQKVTPMRDENTLSNAQKLSFWQNGMDVDNNGKITYNADNDPELLKRKAWKEAGVLSTGNSINGINEVKEEHDYQQKIQVARSNRAQVIKTVDDNLQGITTVKDLEDKIGPTAGGIKEDIPNEILTVKTAGGPVKLKIKGYIACEPKGNGEYDVTTYHRGDTHGSFSGRFTPEDNIYETNMIGNGRSQYRFTQNEDRDHEVPAHTLTDKETTALLTGKSNLSKNVAAAVDNLRSYSDFDHPFYLIHTPYGKKKTDYFYYLVVETVNDLPYGKTGINPEDIQAADEAEIQAAIEAAKNPKKQQQQQQQLKK